MKCQVHDIPLIVERGGPDMPTVHGRTYCPECSKALMKALDKVDAERAAERKERK